MARLFVNEALVFAAADQLAAAGTAPTLLTVQAAIGGGSYTTVKRHLDAWQQAQQQQRIPLPPEVAAQVHAAAHTVWTAALQHTAQQLADAAQRLAAAETEIERQEALLTEQVQVQATLATALQELERTRDALRAAVAQAETHAARLAGQVATLTAQRDADQVAIAALHRQLREEAQQLGELAALRQQTTAQAALIARLARHDADPAANSP